MQINSICVYCASSNRIKPVYFDAAISLGHILAENQIALVYGGHNSGLMGQLASAVLSQGGKVIGVMPKFMEQLGWSHSELSELVLVEDMHQRKKRFLEDSDALIALPGGTGTLEELLEAITLKRLGQFNKPIIIVNTNHFYDPLIEILKNCIEENFMSPAHGKLWTVVQEPYDILEAIRLFPPLDDNAIQFARIE